MWAVNETWECSCCKEEVVQKIVGMETFTPAQGHSQHSPWSLGTEVSGGKP